MAYEEVKGSNALLVVMEPELKKALVRAANKSGVSMAEYMRMSLRAKIREDRKERVAARRAA